MGVSLYSFALLMCTVAASCDALINKVKQMWLKGSCGIQQN